MIVLIALTNFLITIFMFAKGSYPAALLSFIIGVAAIGLWIYNEQKDNH